MTNVKCGFTLNALSSLIFKSKSEVKKINQFHKKFLKQVMHLKERTADSAVYLLAGQLPLGADLHKRILGTLGSVLRSSSIEREIAEPQILLKDHKSKSWFVCQLNFVSILIV